MFKRCKHNWEVVTDKVLESGYEQTEGRLREIDGPGAAAFFGKTSVTILKCTKCGKIDKTVVRST